MSSSGNTPFINDSYFIFEYGDTTKSERIIDSQWITSNIYKSTVMNNNECFFGVNFADGRIKCYPTENPKRENAYFIRYVRGNEYGINDFSDQDNIIVDHSTNLTWTKKDNGEGVIWNDALSYCNDLTLDSHSDWRLPNAKELHSIVDYDRSPNTTDSAAIDPKFNVSVITNEAGEKDYPFYWTSTTHKKEKIEGASAAYISFGRALGNMSEFGGWIDVHGAGAQRSDQKAGDPSEYSDGHGPQGDAVRIYNYVRCVRN